MCGCGEPGIAIEDLGGEDGSLDQVEMVAGQSTHRIVILSHYNLLENCEEAAANMTFLCAGAESEALAETSDRDLARGVAGAALQVCLLI